MSIIPATWPSAFDLLLVIPVTLVRHLGTDDVDDNGEQVFTTDEYVTRCYVQQEGAHEENDAAVLVDYWRFWLPAETMDAAPRGWDALVLEDGSRYELEGDPWPVQNPRLGGAVHHLEAHARRSS